MYEKISTKVGQIHNKTKDFRHFLCNLFVIPTHFLKLKKITTGKNRSTDNYIYLKHSEHSEHPEDSEFLNLPHRVFLQFSCMNFGVYLQRETVK